MMKQIHELGLLFEEVQMKNILGDGKTFPDCLPKRSLDDINREFLDRKNSASFDLKKFVDANFTMPKAYSTGYQSDLSQSPQHHIEKLWEVLRRNPDGEGGSLISLPHPYIVPGGRFREIYYWDSYFTMLGLRVSKRSDLIQNMVSNFEYLIDKIGYIPNGNRTYFLGRSQPPFFSLMVKLISEERRATNRNKNEADPLLSHLPFLEKEYQFWMKGSDRISHGQPAQHRVVLMEDGSLLNRYWDENNTPRPEAFREDVELSHHSHQRPEELYRNLRAAAESGWDFSSRWFKDGKSFGSIHTTDVIPVDLNCLLFHLEQVLAEGHGISGNQAESTRYHQLADQRKSALNKYCWNADEGFFFDFDFVERMQKAQWTLAAAFPLFFEMTSAAQALAVEKIIRKEFLKAGGVTTTLEFSGQQWDAPNGWAPLQWITFKGLMNYGLHLSANEIKSNWIDINSKVYRKSGKMTEKYDVWSQEGEARGGEYPNQDGFGWTNGVYLAMTAEK